jgi:two-component system nitrate/nitrite sensor histidine kinase NarQ
MSTKQIKGLILAIPTLTIGIWEYLRHTILLPHISMELGNLLSPIIIFFVTITLVSPLFRAYEHLSQQLKQERASKQLLQERERIARELHDGIAQTLFLSSVQVEKLKAVAPHEQWRELQHSLHHIQEYVRRSIHTLKTETQLSLPAQLTAVIDQFRFDTGIEVVYEAHFQEDHFSPKEGWEIPAIVSEALTNIRKHAAASKAKVKLISNPINWELTIEDNGVGFDPHNLQASNSFGLSIMKQRAEECKATFSFLRKGGKTIVHIQKEI